jgi:RHS repeat-associated protein
MWGSDLSGSPQGAGGVGGLLAIAYHGTSLTNAFAAYDGNGNLSAFVNAADGTVVASYEYGPFGEVIRATGPMAKANPIRFSTKYQDDESDLLYYGYRYYKSSTGTWVSRDRIGEAGGDNIYEFSIDNPISLFDRLGNATYTSDDLLSIQPMTIKRIPCGILTLMRVFVDASNTKSLISEDLGAYNDLIASLQKPPSTLNEAKIRDPSYLGSGFILRFDKVPGCPCEKFEWLQTVSRPNGKAWKQDYDWTSSTGANFRAADFPGENFSGFISRDWTWKFQLTLYCYGCGTKTPLTTVTWSSHIILNGLGSTPYATVNLNIDGF